VNIIKTRTAQIWRDEEGIIHKIFLEGADETLADALESEKIIKDLSEGKRLPLLVDFSPIRSIDAGARRYYSTASTLVAAVGGITRSRLGRLIGNFFLGFNRNRLETPGRLFENEEEAVKWLKTFL